MQYNKTKLEKTEPFAASSMLQQRRGQVAETTVWIVATIIIIFVLLVSVYAASLLSVSNKSISLSEPTFAGNNVLLKKSMYGFLLTKNQEGINIYNRIDSEKDIDDQTKILGTLVFKQIYNSPDIISIILRYNKKDYNLFLSGIDATSKVLESVKFDKDSAIELIINIGNNAKI